MDHIAKVLQSASPGSTPRPSAEDRASSRGSSPLFADVPAEPVMRRLWQRMAEIYGHRWTSAYGEDAGSGAGPTWAKGLAGIAPSQIATGLEQALVSADEWPPTLPAFRAMCFAIPAFAAVRAEVNAKDSRRSPFAMLTWEHLDRHRYRMADADKADRLLREAYDTAREHVMRGGALPEPVEELAAPAPAPRTPVSPEVAAAAFADIAAILGDAPEAA
jgi:hypothetical protein